MDSPRSYVSAMFCVAILLLILLYSRKHFVCPSLPIIIRYPGHVNFHQAYQVYRENKSRFDTNMQMWQSDSTLLLDEVSLCEANSSPELIILVKTTYEKRALREQIRRSWGSPRCFAGNNMTVHVLFVLGKVQRWCPVLTSKCQELLSEEHAKHRDLLQFGFLDTYRNTTHKHAAALNYITKRCPGTHFVALFDDDFLVNPVGVVRTLRGVSVLHYPIFFGGYTHDSEPIIRNPSNKWFIPHDVYPFELVPRIAAGGSVLMSMPVAKLLAFGLHLIPYIPVDDTAMALVLLNFGISPTDLPEVYPTNEINGFDAEKLKHFISMHGFSTVQSQKHAWKKLVHACGDKN
ncbi:N-acetyllactosaminide 3-alpha-galactosyltransferase [Opisthorchis viverrini]|nr:N-acetyllactosaminide 3-alpha-galactosyltransferase [Opisthorchis viverrini]